MLRYTEIISTVILISVSIIIIQQFKILNETISFRKMITGKSDLNNHAFDYECTEYNSLNDALWSS